MNQKRTSYLIKKNYSNSSVSYFLKPYIKNCSNKEDIATSPRYFFNLKGLDLILICRYINLGSLIYLIKRNKAKAIYFFDDDLFDFNAIRKLPLKYFLKIFFSAYIYKYILKYIIDEFWVSNVYLQKKYAYLKPKLIHPHQIKDQSKASKKIIICYHGSASHISEIRWLLPIISEVQKRLDNTHFELFGNTSINKTFKHIPRVSVLHPMSWENYLAYTYSHKTDMGLAPLLDSKFNLGRSPIKYFDYARMGAVGIYSDNLIYNRIIVNNKNGILLKNEPEVWIKKIVELATDIKKLKKLKIQVGKKTK